MKKLKIPKIGMRNIKTATAVFFCMLLFELINREQPFYACIASVICMQPTVDNTLKSGLARAIGTIIGGSVGILFLLIGENFLVNILGEYAYLLIVPVAIIIAIEVCVTLGKSTSVSICCVVLISVLTVHRLEGDYIVYSLNRILDTIVGIIIAAIVNKYMRMPDFIKEKLNKKSQ